MSLLHYAFYSFGSSLTQINSSSVLQLNETIGNSALSLWQGFSTPQVPDPACFSLGWFVLANNHKSAYLATKQQSGHVTRQDRVEIRNKIKSLNKFIFLKKKKKNHKEICFPETDSQFIFWKFYCTFLKSNILYAL